MRPEIVSQPLLPPHKNVSIQYIYIKTEDTKHYTIIIYNCGIAKFLTPGASNKKWPPLADSMNKTIY